MVIKIAVAGEIRSGKDSVCDYIKEKQGLHFQKLYFARGIEMIIRNYFPEAFVDNNKPRKHFQEIGQFMRTVNPNVWVNQLARDMRFYQEYGVVNFLVTDLRQPNEYEWLKENGFTIIKVEAEPEVRIQRMQESGDKFDMQSLVHPVEQQIKHLPYDYLITNNTTLDDLYKQVDYVIAELKAEGGA